MIFFRISYVGYIIRPMYIRDASVSELISELIRLAYSLDCWLVEWYVRFRFIKLDFSVGIRRKRVSIFFDSPRPPPLAGQSRPNCLFAMGSLDVAARADGFSAGHIGVACIGCWAFLRFIVVLSPIATTSKAAAIEHKSNSAEHEVLSYALVIHSFILAIFIAPLQ